MPTTGHGPSPKNHGDQRKQEHNTTRADAKVVRGVYTWKNQKVHEEDGVRGGTSKDRMEVVGSVCV